MEDDLPINGGECESGLPLSNGFKLREHAKPVVALHDSRERDVIGVGEQSVIISGPSFMRRKPLGVTIREMDVGEPTLYNGHKRQSPHLKDNSSL